MANMFSGNVEKKIPRDLKSCYKTDKIVQNLWVWCERLENWGFRICLAMALWGIVTIISEGIQMGELLKELNIDVENIRAEAAKYNIEIKSVLEVVIENIVEWSLYCFLEYCIYHILALLVGSLATIVQHTRITANIELYKAAKEEGITDDIESDEDYTNNMRAKSKAKNDQPKDVEGLKKCLYCGEIVPITLQRCTCGSVCFEFFDEEQGENVENNGSVAEQFGKCEMCSKYDVKITYAEIRNELGTRYRNVCDDCIEKYNATAVENK